MEISKVKNIKSCKECEDYNVDGYSIVIGDKKVIVCDDCFQDFFNEMEGYIPRSSNSRYDGVSGEFANEEEDVVEDDDVVEDEDVVDEDM